MGYLDELSKEFKYPFSHFVSVVARMNKEQEIDNASNTITINMDEKIEDNITSRKNFGYAALSRIYHELEIHKFLLNLQRNLDVEYSLNNIMKLMVFSRLLGPCSKKKTFENKDCLNFRIRFQQKIYEAWGN